MAATLHVFGVVKFVLELVTYFCIYGYIFRQPAAPGAYWSFSQQSMAVGLLNILVIFVAARIWRELVDDHVPEPYLDEVFHIPQAQAYCAWRFWDWDDKITTPPGLYLFSLALHAFATLWQCTHSSLRYTNNFAVLLLVPLVAQCRQRIEARNAERHGKRPPPRVSFYSYHTTLNVVLFPVLFFFSALYYTDVVSTLAVLVAYWNHLVRVGPQRPSFRNDVLTIVLGISALFMRQTNVFWVVVYMGGLEAVHVLRTWEPAGIHDPPLKDSAPEDWLICMVTLAAAALRNPQRLLRQIWPHIVVLGLFAGFVAWNGGVVLGDKSNHIATIHLAQMLYIWPLFAFFSAPLFIPSAFSLIALPARFFRSPASGVPSATSAWRSTIDTCYAVFAAVLSLAIVRYNTIVHPFTLADNRHYMFYVFRYTILRSRARRFALVAAYTLCRWLVWDTLAGNPSSTVTAIATTTTENNHKPEIPPQGKPLKSRAVSTTIRQRLSPAALSEDRSSTTRTTTPTTPSSSSSSLSDDLQPLGQAEASPAPPATSTAVLLFLATALSLVTAPLVEPRYFILPWVFYRLLVPAWRNPLASSAPSTAGRDDGSSRGKCRYRVRMWMWKLLRDVDVDTRLVLETAWFVAVNLATMYMFLQRPFYWRGENGEVLDGGRMQRFMW